MTEDLATTIFGRVTMHRTLKTILQTGLAIAHDLPDFLVVHRSYIGRGRRQSDWGYTSHQLKCCETSIDTSSTTAKLNF